MLARRLRFFFLTPAMLTVLAAACGDSKPEARSSAPPGATPHTPGPAVPKSPVALAPVPPPDSTATSSSPTPSSHIVRPSADGLSPGAHEKSTQTAAHPLARGFAWDRTELIDRAGQFVGAIDSNNETAFWGSLSRRSARMVDDGSLGSRQKIWLAARATLGDVRNRHISVLGGTRDSVALRIDGLRTVEGARLDDPVIIHLLREDGAWKVMYPGLLYPEHDLRKAR